MNPAADLILDPLNPPDELSPKRKQLIRGARDVRVRSNVNEVHKTTQLLGKNQLPVSNRTLGHSVANHSRVRLTDPQLKPREPPTIIAADKVVSATDPEIRSVARWIINITKRLPNHTQRLTLSPRPHPTSFNLIGEPNRGERGMVERSVNARHLKEDSPLNADRQQTLNRLRAETLTTLTRTFEMLLNLSRITKMHLRFQHTAMGTVVHFTIKVGTMRPREEGEHRIINKRIPADAKSISDRPLDLIQRTFQRCLETVN
jgi:hypothetical protein